MPTSPRVSQGGLVAGLAAVVLVAGATGVWAYNRGDSNGDAGGSASGDDAGWTVMQYQIADTDLEPYMMRDLAESGRVGSNENLNIISFVDRAAGYSRQDVLGLKNWTGAKVLEVHDGSAEVIEEVGEVDTGDPLVLADFVADSIERYPAEHYALILSDHGASWPGVGGDESADNDALTLAEIHSAVRSGLDAMDVDKLDMVGFDACLMATYEVASNLAPLADRMVASEELEPGHGWDYRTLQVLADDPTTDVDSFGQALVDGYHGQATDQGTESAITLSVLDLTKMPALDTAVADFSTALQANVADVAPVVGDKRARALTYGRIPDPTIDTHMTDLGSLAADISSEAPAVAGEAQALSAALDAVVVDDVEGPVTAGSSGLSMYFPPEPEYFEAAYNAVGKTAAWAQFLQSYYATGDAIPAVRQPRFVDTDAIADVSFDQAGVHLTGAFDPATEQSLTHAIVTYGQIVGDQVVFLGEEPAAISGDGSGTVSGDYDLTVLTVSDDESIDTGYLDLEIDEESGVATLEVPMAYFADGDPGSTMQAALLHTTVDTTTDVVLDSTTYLLGPDGMVGELTPAPGSVVQPLLLVQGPDGTRRWETADHESPLSTERELVVDFTPLPPQTLLLAQLALTDYGGNEATLDATFVVP